MLVEIWSDVVCPWCYVGKRQFEEALGQFRHGDDVTVEWKSFELDPTAPARRNQSMNEVLQRKYGMSAEQAEAANHKMTDLASSVGLEYHLDRAVMGNTFDAHRLIHLAAANGLGDAMKERLMAAYFTEGQAIGEHDTLEKLAIDVGLDPGDVASVLSSDSYAAAVRHDEQRAQAIGVTGVPFFLIDERLAVPGAQPVEVLVGALEQAWSISHPVTVVTAEGAGADNSCDDGSCAI
jgi:predicted DsbA family dithiol-disulfide isomerase